MKKLDEITLWILIAMLIIMIVQCFFTSYDDIRFIRHCSISTLTFSVFAYIEVIRLRREIKGKC